MNPFYDRDRVHIKKLDNKHTEDSNTIILKHKLIIRQSSVREKKFAGNLVQ